MWFLSVVWFATLVAILAAMSPVSARQLAKWSVRFDVLVEDSATTWVTTRLRRARTVRWTSFAIGLHVGLLPMYVNVIDAERASEFSNALIAQAPLAAAALGAVVAELWLVRSPSGERSASIVARRWTDYIEPVWMVVIAGAVPVSVVASLFASDGAELGRGWLWVGPTATVVAAAAATIGVQMIVSRPARVSGELARRLDDALRADGAHHVIGASVALGGVAACSTLSVALGTSAWGALPVLLSWTLLGCWHGIACSVRWNVDRARLQRA